MVYIEADIVEYIVAEDEQWLLSWEEAVFLVHWLPRQTRIGS